MKDYLKGRRDSGFTLIEIVIVIAIAALILAAVLVFLPTAQKSRRDTARRDAIGKLAAKVETRTADTGAPTAAALNAGLTADADIKDPSTNTPIQLTVGTCPGSATAVGTWVYQQATGAASYKVCTLGEGGTVYSN